MSRPRLLLATARASPTWT